MNTLNINKPTPRKLGLLKKQLLLTLGLSLMLITQTACSETLKTIQQTQSQQSNADFYTELKQQIKAAETSADRDPHKDAYMTSYLLSKNANGDIKQLKQAYLWNVVGDKEKGIMTAPNLSIAGFALYSMYKSGELKLVDPKLDAIWDDRKKVVEYLSYLELPELLVEVRKELAKTDMPIFSAYRFEDLRVSETHLIEIYADGRVKNDGTWAGNLQIKSTPEAVKNFMSDLKKLDFQNWEQPNDWFETSWCELSCYMSNLRVAMRQGTNVKHIFFRANYESFNDRPDKMKSEYYQARHENLVRMAKLRALIEQYFPTSEFRCKNHFAKDKIEGFVEACIQRETTWQNLAKEEK
ncbi:MAG TPA: hypothetical protein PL133_04420 [Methylophilaceae bacterium]|nr:hypothetical protein [Methylophilaceae bacterium]HQC30033.1 hypothetical protein [Methylotenera sp.]